MKKNAFYYCQNIMSCHVCCVQDAHAIMHVYMCVHVGARACIKAESDGSSGQNYYLSVFGRNKSIHSLKVIANSTSLTYSYAGSKTVVL